MHTRKFLAAAMIPAALSVPLRLAAQQSDPPNLPNIVVILTDDQGYGDLSSYGHPTIRTPVIDQLAHDGVRLTSFYSTAPACTPARAAFLTGRYPVRSGMVSPLAPGATIGLPASEITLAEALKTVGYRTALIGKWHLGDRPEFNPTQHGFDEFFGIPYSHDYRPPFVTSAPAEGVPLIRGTAIVERPVDVASMTQRFTTEATNFIRESHEQPFFLYLAHPMPHLPVEPSSAFRGKSRAGRYGDVIEELDWSVGEVLRTLSDLGLEQNTIVVFMSDNGPWQGAPARMMQEGQRPWDTGSAGLLRGAKGSTWEGGVRVPGIVRWPARIPAGHVSAEMVTNMDLYPTLLRIAGADVPDDRAIDGVDVLPVLTGQGPSAREAYYYFSGSNLEAVRQGRWKLRLTGPGEAAGDAQQQAGGAPAPGQSTPPAAALFDLDTDAAERYDVADEHPHIASDLSALLQRFRSEIADSTGDPPPN